MNVMKLGLAGYRSRIFWWTVFYQKRKHEKSAVPIERDESDDTAMVEISTVAFFGNRGEAENFKIALEKAFGNCGGITAQYSERVFPNR